MKTAILALSLLVLGLVVARLTDNKDYSKVAFPRPTQVGDPSQQAIMHAAMEYPVNGMWDNEQRKAAMWRKPLQP